MYDIELTPEAIEDLKCLRKVEQKQVLMGIEEQTLHEPTVETRNRKRLRPNKFSEWELRIDQIRVFYDVNSDACVVSIRAIGRKEGNCLFIPGKQYRL